MTVRELIQSLERLPESAKGRGVVIQHYDSDGCRDGYESVEEAVCEVADKWQFCFNPLPVEVVEIR